jgi:hypothetical protein
MAGSFMWLWHVVKDLNVTKLRQTPDAAALSPDIFKAQKNEQNDNDDG